MNQREHVERLEEGGAIPNQQCNHLASELVNYIFSALLNEQLVTGSQAPLVAEPIVRRTSHTAHSGGTSKGAVPS